MTDKRRPSRSQPRSPFLPEFPDQQSSLQKQHSPDLPSLGNSRSFGREPSLIQRHSFEGSHSPDERHIPGHLQRSNEYPAGHLQQHTPNPLQSLDQHHSLDPSRLSKEEASRVSHSASHSLQHYPAVPWILPPVLYRKVTMLFENLWLPPAEAAQTRVIAVDGVDSQAAQAIVKYLDESIRRHTNLRVRVLPPLICPAFPGSDWFDYTRYINQWNDLWKFLIAECSDQGGRSQSSTAFCVNIVPFSPLMITLRAGSTIHTDSEMEELENWRSLASDWWGEIRPHITINVLDGNCIPHDPGVVRIAGYYMNTLAIAKVAWEADAVDGLTSEQLTRIEFEVLQWLIKWGAIVGAPQASKTGRE